MIEKAQFIWRPVNFHDQLQKRMDKRLGEAGLVVNHFQSLKEIGTKTGLIRSLKQYYYTNILAKAHRYTEFDSTPTTYIITSRQEDSHFLDLKMRFNQIKRGIGAKEKLPLKHLLHNMWLVKPSNAN